MRGKRINVVSMLAVMSIGLSGCALMHVSEGLSDMKNNRFSMVNADISPSNLIGTWKSDDGYWYLKMNPDGSGKSCALGAFGKTILESQKYFVENGVQKFIAAEGGVGSIRELTNSKLTVIAYGTTIDYNRVDDWPKKCSNSN